MKYLGEGKIRPLQPMALFPATQVSAAFAEFANPQRIGKVVVSFSPEAGSSSSSTLAVVRDHKDAVKFKPDGTYVLIGCLGGLGRCLARFMVDRGARNLTFLGRGGADKKEAAAMIDSLRARGCAVHVVRGDVANKEDVAKAVAAAGVPVYGMVQGAMALEVRVSPTLFSLFNETLLTYQSTGQTLQQARSSRMAIPYRPQGQGYMELARVPHRPAPGLLRHALLHLRHDRCTNAKQLLRRQHLP